MDDLLNIYLDSHTLHRDPDICPHQNEANCADYRFVYMGPKGQSHMKISFFNSLFFPCLVQYHKVLMDAYASGFVYLEPISLNNFLRDPDFKLIFLVAQIAPDKPNVSKYSQ
jgi:hypothetical protein